MTNVVRATKSGENVAFFCEKCGRPVNAKEVEEGKRLKARLAVEASGKRSY